MTNKNATSSGSAGSHSYFKDAATREVVPSNGLPFAVPVVPVPEAPVVVTAASTSTAPSSAPADKSASPYSQSGHRVIIKTYAVKRG